MTDIKVGNKLPDDLIDVVPEGISGSFSDKLLFILKMQGLTQEDIAAFADNYISLDLLELGMFKEEIGNLYAFSILVGGFIDNSEVLVDFRSEELDNNMLKDFSTGDGIKVDFVLCDEEDNVLSVRKFMLSNEFSNVICAKAFEQNNFNGHKADKNTDYILLAFEKLFENEPEQNLELYSVGKDIVE